MKPIFTMMVGVAGAGKSTHALKLADEHTMLCSSDAIRLQLYGDASVQKDPKRVFAIMDAKVEEAAARGQDIIYDCMNLSASRRSNYIHKFSERHPEYILKCVFIDTPLNLCLARNEKRARRVPEDVIREQSYRLIEPRLYEGWNEIIRVDEKGVEHEITN